MLKPEKVADILYVHMDSSVKKILGAFFVGFIMISLALLIKFLNPTTNQEGELAVINTSATQRSHIEVSDNDHNGIPDWQEALHKNDPVLTEKNTGEYKPDTLTEEFSVEFLKEMVLASNYGEFGSSQDEIVKQATDQLANQAVDELYGATDITVSNSNDSKAVRNYINQLARIANDYTVSSDSLNEVEILKQAYVTEDPDRLNDLDPIISMYKNMIDRSLALSVPSEYSKEHLDLVNVYNAVYKDISAMKMAFSDPLQTVVRLKRYEEDVTSLYVVLLNLQKKVLLSGVQITETDPAYRFFVNP